MSYLSNLHENMIYLPWAYKYILKSCGIDPKQPMAPANICEFT